TNPVSLTWSLKLKNTVDFNDVGSFGVHPEYTLQFQPTMPLLLTPYLKLITRPEFTLIDDTAYTNGQGELQHTTGLGDTILDLVLSPRLGCWLIGLGPTFVFPTANLEQTGEGKWQAGPAGVLGDKTKTWLVGAIFQLQGLYVPVYPDQNGERWSLQFNIIPIVPALREGPLFDRS